MFQEWALLNRYWQLVISYYMRKFVVDFGIYNYSANHIAVFVKSQHDKELISSLFTIFGRYSICLIKNKHMDITYLYCIPGDVIN